MYRQGPGPLGLKGLWQKKRVWSVTFLYSFGGEVKASGVWGRSHWVSPRSMASSVVDPGWGVWLPQLRC